MKSNKWIIYTFWFAIITIVLFLVVMWNPMWGCFSFLLLCLVYLVGNILKGFFAPPKRADSNAKIIPLSQEDIGNSRRLLRYATAILALLSLITTASGMKSFVFDQSWMAYIGSFAVQSILVVFSLLLCRFFVQITVLGWPLYIKRAVNELMIIFFCTALIVSSTFSFTFIANNAYCRIWPSDNEMIIREFLLKETENLNDENEKRGKQIIELINENAGEKLESAVAETRAQKEKEWKQDILDLVQLLPTTRAKKGTVDFNEAELISVYPQYIDDIHLLGNHYKDFSNYYDQAVSDYNQIVKKVKGWDAASDSQKTSNQIQSWIHKIDNVRNELKNRKESIESLKTYKLNQDFSIVRTRYISAVNTLSSDFSDMKKTLGEIKKVSDKMNQMLSSDGSDEVEEILSEIYLLDVEKKEAEKNENDDQGSSAENLVEKINDLMLSASKEENSDSEMMSDLVWLKDAIKQYSEYMELKNNLLSFRKNNVQKTYSFEITKEKQISEKSLKSWKKERNDDFDQLSIYLKSLPDMTNVNTENNNQYNTEDILDMVTVYQRDLLGNLTDFEKAFNYFKYKFPVMAYFSAFIAVFFDLGSFFTGCFLFAIEYFDVKEKRKSKKLDKEAVSRVLMRVNKNEGMKK